MASPNRRITLTSNSTPSPCGASASSEFIGTSAFNAFDGTKDVAGTEWITNNTTTGYLIYDFGSAIWAIDGIGIQPQATARAPKNFTVEGSVDGVSYDVLLTVTNQTVWTSNVMTDFAITGNNKRYRYIKINVSANNGDANFLEIEEVYFYARDLSITISTE